VHHLATVSKTVAPSKFPTLSEAEHDPRYPPRAQKDSDTTGALVMMAPR
jgi:hypothetical protein